jgi:hypothetical protein
LDQFIETQAGSRIPRYGGSPPSPNETSDPGPPHSALFSEAAQFYEQGYLSRDNQLARPTREKEKYFLKKHIEPRWGATALTQMHPQAIEEWLHASFRSWWTRHGVRGIMSRVFHYAEGHDLWEGAKQNPAAKAKLGKKRYQYERRILSLEETARVSGTLTGLFTQVNADFVARLGKPFPIEISVSNSCGSPLTQGAVVASFSNGDNSIDLVPLGDGRWTGTWIPTKVGAIVEIRIRASRTDDKVETNEITRSGTIVQ